jgi:hypothetical protein
MRDKFAAVLWLQPWEGHGCWRRDCERKPGTAGERCATSFRIETFSAQIVILVLMGLERVVIVCVRASTLVALSLKDQPYCMSLQMNPTTADEGKRSHGDKYPENYSLQEWANANFAKSFRGEPRSNEEKRDCQPD